MTDLTDNEELAVLIAMFLIEHSEIRLGVQKWLEGFLIEMWQKLTNWNKGKKEE